jgi:hypothetical protein
MPTVVDIAGQGRDTRAAVFLVKGQQNGMAEEVLIAAQGDVALPDGIEQVGPALKLSLISVL